MSLVQLGMGWFPEQPGGLNRYFYDLIHALEVRNLDFHALVAGSNPLVSNQISKVVAFAEKDASLWKRWSGVKREVQKSISTANSASNVYATHFALYAFPLRTHLKHHPHIVHFHGPWADESAAENGNPLSVLLKRQLERQVYRTGDAFIVLSQAFAKVLHERYGIPEAKIHVIPGAVDHERFSFQDETERCRKALDWPTNRKIVVCVRRLARRMGIGNLIEAVRMIQIKHPDLLLMIGGKGPLQEELKTAVEQNKLQEHVRLLGYISDEDLPKVYGAADLSIVPTESWEGFGLITLESLSTGTPVLVTPVGGLPEAVGGLSENCVLDDRSVESIAHGMDRALSNPGFLPSRQACREYIETHHTWPVITDRIIRIYDEVKQKYL